jgi:hypothetical protein
MITIATFTLPEDAHLFRMFLESRDVPAVLLDEHFAQLFWHYSNAIGGVRVAVEESDAEAAAALHGEYMASLRTGPYPVKPPRLWPVVALLSLAVGAPFLLFGRGPAGKGKPED